MNANKNRSFRAPVGRRIDSPDSEPVNHNAIVCSSDRRGAMNFQWKRALTPSPARPELVEGLPVGEGGREAG